jgi:hypothetical protein
MPGTQTLLTGLGFGESPRWHAGRWWLAAGWHGMEHMFDGATTGQVLVAEAPAPGAGWPAAR